MNALIGPHGEVAELGGEAAYFDSPGVKIRRVCHVTVVPKSSIGTNWISVPGQVVETTTQTGRWTTPVETTLGIKLDGQVIDCPVLLRQMREKYS